LFVRNDTAWLAELFTDLETGEVLRCKSLRRWAESCRRGDTRLVRLARDFPSSSSTYPVNVSGWD
jgi:outer membrane biogenesis lipoprotein LolB